MDKGWGSINHELRLSQFILIFDNLCSQLFCTQDLLKF